VDLTNFFSELKGRNVYKVAIAYGVVAWAATTTSRILSAENGRPPATAGSLPPKSITVLPFDNLSRDPDNAYFAEACRTKF
jgi:hypothetical protein